MTPKSEAMDRFTGELASATFQPGPGGERMMAGGATLQQIKTPFITALSVQQPRNRKAVLEHVIEEVHFDPEKMYYSWPVKNRDGTTSRVEGPTIRMAMTIAREWGNCSTDAEVIADEGTHWRFKGYFIDTERGFVSAREYRMRKPTEGKGRIDLDRTVDMAFQIGQSKAIRNAVTNGVPVGFLSAALKAAKEIEGDQIVSDGVARGIARCIDTFKPLSVSAQQLEAKLGKPQASWTREDLIELRGIYNAIEEGQTTVALQFEGQSGTDDLAASMGLSNE